MTGQRGNLLTDFSVNATGTLNLLEATRQFSPEAPFIFTSTNKVYGDSPNRLPLVEQETRWELDSGHEFAERGITEEQSIDQTLHSVFGSSKVAADVMVQEYGRYFGLQYGLLPGRLPYRRQPFRRADAWISGIPDALQRHRTPYTVFGYKGKQVRDNLHSSDLVRAFDRFFQDPGSGEVYNIGGSRFSNCSLREAISMCEEISGREMKWEYVPENRTGDHIWWISDIGKFQSHYPGYEMQFDIRAILREIHDKNRERWREVFSSCSRMNAAEKNNLLGVLIDDADRESAADW